jgi:hypothetical protein
MNKDQEEEVNREKEKELLIQTDNGWQEGDPVDQPENPEPWNKVVDDI